MDAQSLLGEILSKLQDVGLKKESSTRAVLSSIFGLVNSLETKTPSLPSFLEFLQSSHDLLIHGDTAKRASMIRTIRYSLVDESYCDLLITIEIHWIIVTSLELDGTDYYNERMQALKLIDKFLSITPLKFPIAFARSLVAITNTKEDNFRKYCMETLRNLSIKNPKLVAQVSGFSPLMDAIIEPVNQQLADKNMMTILYLLNNEDTRKIVSPNVDLMKLLAPFVDTDTDSTELIPRWEAAKAALVTMMRSWVGVVHLVSFDQGLPTLIRMLRDIKVDVATHDIILDAISEILAPITAKIKESNKNRHQQVWVSSGGEGFRFGESVSAKGSRLDMRSTSNPAFRNDSEVNFSVRNRKFSDASESEYSSRAATNVSEAQKISKKPSFFALSAQEERSTFSYAPSGKNSNHSEEFNYEPVRRGTISSVDSAGRSDRKNGVAANKQSSSNSTQSKFNSRNSFSIAAFFHPRSNSNTKENIAKRPSNATLSSGKNPTVLSGSSNGKESSKDPRKFSVGSKADKNEAGFSNNAAAFARVVNASPDGETANVADDYDMIYNLMDNYTALICCAFLHVDLIKSLYFLGMNGTVPLAMKSRDLLVDFLRTLAHILPDSRCSELLTIPSLLEVASTVGGGSVTRRAHKSSQILVALADAFSVMPYKQVSGSHVSGLNGNTSNGTNRSRSISYAQPSRNSSLAGNAAATAMITGTGPISSAIRSNFPSLNIQTLFELAEEIKISSFTNIASATSDVSSGSILSGATNDLVTSLRESITPNIEKNDFMKQMELSRVIGKEGKEPFKWDWLMLSDMLEYSFYNPDRLNEALRTKWIRRVSGFYRCNTDDKAYFANLDWDPTNLQYLECACNLYSVLLKDDAGRAFLTSDRRGMLFNEMASEIHYLLVNAASSNYDKNIGGGISNSSSGGANSPGGPPPQKSVFRLFSCNTSMAREFFTLLGRIVKTSGARRLLDGTHIFQNLSRLGSNKSLDYLTRLVFTSLSFTDEGVLSRHLIQLWTAQDSCTPELKVYFHSILRILLQSKRGSSLGPGGSANTVSEYNWVIDVILNQINIGERPTLMICKALEEAVHSKPILRSIIAKKPKILDEPNAQNVLIRFLSVPEGIEYLSESSWLEEALEDWKTKKCKEYAESVEERISLVFTEGNGRQFPRYCRMVEPIPIYTPEFLNTIRLKQSSYVKPSIMSSSATSSSSINRDPNSKLVLDLQGLMRVPWNIELKLTTQPTGSRASYTSTVEYVRMDTYADMSEIVSPYTFDTISDECRIFKVKGVVLDNRGIPFGQAISQTKVISNTLMAGTCPIMRNGRVHGSVEKSTKRRPSTATKVVDNNNNTNLRQTMTTNPLNEPVNSDSDLPVTFQQENSFDWSVCKPLHRQTTVVELENSQFAVTIAGEPCVWIFSRKSPAEIANVGSSYRGSRHMSIGQLNDQYFPSNRHDSSRIGGIVYLLEVQYYFKIVTGHAVLVPLPRHIYGELARTLDGCQFLAEKSIVSDLIATVHRENISQEELSAALWSLGNIASTELGFLPILNADPEFVEWCIYNTQHNQNFSIRSTFFYVIGLLSRTARGASRLDKCDWDTSPIGSNSAVAVPRNPSTLFVDGLSGYKPLKTGQSLRKTKAAKTIEKLRRDGNVSGKLMNGSEHSSDISNPSSINVSPPASVAFLSPSVNAQYASIEIEILNLIVKLPGVILYRDSMNQLEKLKKSNPEVFLNRTLYSEVHRILESYTFKLSARREVLAFFPKKARLKKKSSDPPLPIFLMEPPRTPTPGKHSRSASDCPTPTAVMENE